MPTKKTTRKKTSKKKKTPDAVEKFRLAERNWFKEWNPEILLVTVVGIVLILGVTALASARITHLSGQVNAMDSQIDALHAQVSTLRVSGGECLFDLADTDGTLCDMKESLDQNIGTAEFQIPLESNVLCTESTACLPENGKARILRFVSPTCPYCTQQEESLDKVAVNYPEVEVLDVCLAIHAGDDQLCQDNAADYDLPFDEGMELANIFKVGGTPTMVIDCVYNHVGSYAIYDQQMNTSIEQEDLTQLFEVLSA